MTPGARTQAADRGWGTTLVIAGARSLRRSLPAGGSLPESAWKARHRGIVALLWLHVPAVVLFGLAVGVNPAHAALEALPIASAAFLARRLCDHRTASTIVASVGLMTCSAVLVHLSGGVIEAHFHFFVMVGVVVLYQEWWPFLIAIAYVVLHHGVMGALFPGDVYNHAAAVNGPWKWAGIHGAFILAMSVAGVLAWRLNETLRGATARSEQQLAEAQHLAHLGSWEWDIRTDRLEWSDELYRIFGFSRDGAAPCLDWFMERVHPDDRATVARSLEEARESGSEFWMDFRYTNTRGELGWMHGRGQPVRDEHGTVVTMRGTGQDITETKRMQAAVEKEGVLLRGLLEMVAVAANEAPTVSEAIQVALDQVCGFTGWPIGHAFRATAPGGRLASTGIWRIGDPDRFDAFRQTTQAMSIAPGVGLAGGVLSAGVAAWVSDITLDSRFTRAEAAREAGIRSAFAFPLLVGQKATGVLEFFSTTPEPVDEQLLEVIAQVGKQLGLVVEKNRAMDELRASYERHRTIVETASDAFIEMDQYGVITDWNRSADAMFGWSREEAIGQLASRMIPQELRAAPLEGRARYLATGVGPAVSNRVEVEAVRRDGVRFPVEVAVGEVVRQGNLFFNAFVRDMSHQKQTEDALASARDQALEASRLKSGFLANMSHEIRTPMNGVIGLTSLLLGTDLDETQRNYAEGVRSAGETLLTIIDDILDLSKIEAGRVEFEEVDFDLGDVIEDSARVLAGPAAAKDIELAAWCLPGVPTRVRGDPVRLQQVLLNLLGNAVKFTERGEVTLRVLLAEPAGRKEVHVRFEVQDTGIGIAPFARDRVFEPFAQADASTTRRFGGTGLGLALVKRLVELMGGETGVESELGRGSTFWFTLRLARQTGVVLAPTAAPSLEGVRALVVDDNATNRLILERELTACGMRAETLQEPLGALDVLRAAAAAGEPFGVALLDMQMPEMDGLALSDAIAADPLVAELPVIILSSAQTLSAARRSGAGAKLSLMKPIRQSELYDALLRVLSPTEQPGPAARGRPERPPAVRGRGRVLVVEDNTINQTVAAGTLAKLGYSTDLAVNGREAVEAVSRRDYAAVLMDCQMPEMDGYEATREIRKRQAGLSGPNAGARQRHLPIIAMTASATEVDRERCLAAGMDDYLSKPVRSESMEATLERWLGSPTGHAPSRAPAAEKDDGVLDRTLVDQLRELGPADDGGHQFVQLVDTFVAQSATRLDDLRQAAEGGDFEALGRAAHTQRGSSTVMGAAALASACAALEAASKEGGGADVRARLEDVEAQLERAATALRLESQQP